MTNNIPTDNARQGRSGTHLLYILVAGLILAGLAWGVAEFYGEQAKTPSTQQPAKASSPPAGETSSDPSLSKSDTVNSEPTDKAPQVDKNPAPRSSTGGDQTGTPPTQPASP